MIRHPAVKLNPSRSTKKTKPDQLDTQTSVEQDLLIEVDPIEQTQDTDE